MDWIIAVAVVIALAGIVYYALRLAIDLLVIAAMIFAGIVKAIAWPFRHRR